MCNVLKIYGWVFYWDLQWPYTAPYVCIIRDTRDQIETDADWAITQISPIFRINQGPLCFALFAFVNISKVNLKRFQSKHTGDRSVGGYRFSKTIPKLRGMGYNSDSTNFQDDLRPAMLNPSDMCEVTRVDRTWRGLDWKRWTWLWVFKILRF